MNNLVFSSGMYDVSVPGAIKVITNNLFYESSDKLSGAIIGVGKFSDSEHLTNKFYQIDILPNLRRKTFLIRLLSRIKKLIDYRNPNPILLKVLFEIEEETHKIADRIASQQLERLINNNISIEAVIGLTGLSLNLGKLAKQHGIKYGLHSQFSHPNFQNKQLEEGYKGLSFKPPLVSSKKLERQLLSLELADFIWSPSEFARESYIRNGISKDKIFSNNYGIPVKEFQRSFDEKKSNNLFTILFVGNVGIQKGINILLEAVKLTNFSQIEIIFNGAADPYADLIIEGYEGTFKKRGIEIRVDPGDPRRHYDKANVFILPSIHDSFGIVVLEAMVAGLPVIVSDHVGAKEIVNNGFNGFIFPSGNAFELANKIEFFYNNREKTHEFGKNSTKIGSEMDYLKQGSMLSQKIRTYF